MIFYMFEQSININHYQFITVLLGLTSLNFIVVVCNNFLSLHELVQHDKNGMVFNSECELAQQLQVNKCISAK